MRPGARLPSPRLRPREASPASRPDSESNAWLRGLRADGPLYDETVGRLYALLLRAARFEVSRRRAGLQGVGGNELDDIAAQSADDALVAILRKLDSFRGESRFTTWAYKFALLEAGVKLRRRAWREREVPLEPEHLSLFGDPAPSPHQQAEQSELLSAIREAIATALTPRQREVLVAVALNGVPIDVLAERMGTTRGALYKVLHDARRRLRAELARSGIEPSGAFVAEGGGS